MASSYETFKDLDLTRDELERFTDALKDKNFRKLLVDYVDEVRSPENQKLYQQEITQLEKERGVDVTFINPVAAYVIKTSVNGDKKAFINICANEYINKPSSVPSVQEGSRGLQWSLPHSLAPPREDVDNKGVRCQVYDVVFHPDTVHLAQKNKAFRDMVNKTACDSVESNYQISLDRNNLKFPKLQYKGMAQAAVIRKPSNEKSSLTAEEKEVMDQFYTNAGIPEYPPKQSVPSSPKKSSTSQKKSSDDLTSQYTTPNYLIKHRRHVELEEFTEHKTSKINTAIPKELVVEINLPLLKSSADIVLDVAEKTLQLTSEKPAKYKLQLTLPYRVNQNTGNAKFDKDKKKLIVTLPVKLNKNIFCEQGRDDSGVESDHGSVTSSSPVYESDSSILTSLSHSSSCAAEINPCGDVVKQTEFLDPNLHYSLPEFTINVSDNNNLLLTLNVKNVDSTSIQKQFNESESDLHIKFTTISSGFFPLYYSFYIRIPEQTIDTDKLSIEVWDNNVLIQINCKPCDKTIDSYFFGLQESELTLKQLDLLNDNLSINTQIVDSLPHSTSMDNSPIVNSTINSLSEELGQETVSSESKKKRNKKDRKKSKNGNKKRQPRAGSLDHEATETEDEEKLEKFSEMDSLKNQTFAIDIVRSFSQPMSDGDVSFSLSPNKGRGILKSFSRQFGRSISESGLDEVSWASSVENFCTSVDSVIPEEAQNGEMSTSYKKTVRFNDVVSRQLYRSNSSILGQKKKNQRKALAKKRAQIRRHSESEASENEEKKDKCSDTGDESENNDRKETDDFSTFLLGNPDVKEGNNYFSNDIFQLDMN